MDDFEEKYVKDFYNTKSDEFSNSRTRPWPSTQKFLDSNHGLILDVGCGNGRNLKSNMIGVDISENLINYAKNKNSELAVADCANLPFIDSIFDGVISVAVLHHLKSIERRKKAVLEMWRVCKVDARIYVCVWLESVKNHNNVVSVEGNDILMDWKNSGNLRFYHLFEMDELEKIVKECGFEIIEKGVDKENAFVVGLKR